MSQSSPFGSESVIDQRISEAKLKAYLVGFDYGDYRWSHLINVLERVIPEFALGHHLGTQINITDIMPLMREAANSIYRIDDFKKAKELYLNDNPPEDDSTEKNLCKRGEFGELILHLLLRDFHNTVPLLSKIYFKDSDGTPVHGFDAIHIQEDTMSLWLGESKLYICGEKGVKALVEDIKNHFERNYLDREFALISKKLQPFNNIPKKDEWIKLLQSNRTLRERLSTINIPLLCTYSSENFTHYSDESNAEFKEAFEREIRRLKEIFDKDLEDKIEDPIKTDLNVILLLFPVPCKNTLVKKMHQRLTSLQGDS